MNSAQEIAASVRIADALNRGVNAGTLLGKFNALAPEWFQVYWGRSGQVQLCRVHRTTDVSVCVDVNFEAGSVCSDVMVRVGGQVAWLSPRMVRRMAMDLLQAANDAERAGNLYAGAVAAEGGAA